MTRSPSSSCRRKARLYEFGSARAHAQGCVTIPARPLALLLLRRQSSRQAHTNNAAPALLPMMIGSELMPAALRLANWPSSDVCVDQTCVEVGRAGWRRGHEGWDGGDGKIERAARGFWGGERRRDRVEGTRELRTVCNRYLHANDHAGGGDSNGRAGSMTAELRPERLTRRLRISALRCSPDGPLKNSIDSLALTLTTNRKSAGGGDGGVVGGVEGGVCGGGGDGGGGGGGDGGGGSGGVCGGGCDGGGNEREGW